MTLKKLSYSEYEGDPRCWSLESLDLEQANLVVGRNATGKSRLINVTTGLMGLLAGTRVGALDSGKYHAEFLIKNVEYWYDVEFSDKKVQNERLTVDGVERLTRGLDGKGRIFYEKEGNYLEFEVDASAIAIQARRDRLQHPFIVELSEWAASSATYNFGTDFGRNTLMVATPGMAAKEVSTSANEEDASNALSTYIEGFKRFGDSFDKAIIEDMAALGYPLREVHAEPLPPSIAVTPHGAPFMVLTVIEDGIQARLPQIFLSQGMYRALALTIKLNWAVFTGRQGLILIDDLGEGLDFERSCSAVEMTLRKAKGSNCQIVVTSNDRFVMNAVPLENWVVLHREGAVVKAFTARNSPEAFEDFRFTGLSNFDFFSSQAFH